MGRLTRVAHFSPVTMQVGKEMAEPEDMGQATCLQKTFVFTRMALYFTVG
jgi:hypothetical protein